MFVDDFDKDKDVLNIEEILLDSYVLDETSILANFIEVTPLMLCFNKTFECIEERPRLRLSIEKAPKLELKPLPNHFQYAYLCINYSTSDYFLKT